jgi:PAS domain S-box-containing protein
LIGHSKSSRDGQPSQAAAGDAPEPSAPRDQLYREVVEDQSEFICRYRPDCTLTFVNAAYCRQFGRDASELIGRSLLPLIPEADRARMESRITALTREAPVVISKRRELGSDGSIRWYRWTDRGIFDAAGKLIEIQAVGQDVTEAERQTRMLEGQNEILELITQDLQLHEILERLAMIVERIAAPTMCSILGLRDNGRQLYTIAAPGLPEAYSRAIDGITIGPKVGSCGTAVYLR